MFSFGVVFRLGVLVEFLKCLVFVFFLLPGNFFLFVCVFWVGFWGFLGLSKDGILSNLHTSFQPVLGSSVSFDSSEWSVFGVCGHQNFEDMP